VSLIPIITSYRLNNQRASALIVARPFRSAEPRWTIWQPKAADATTPAVKEHLRDLAARFECLAERVDEVASG
jgi:hypothetical protein